jgi:GH24 family phage-related lysozyme (muramidase)
LNQNQNDALVSFVYNVGDGNFQKSTLLRLLNQGNYAAVPAELKKWTKARQNGQLIDLPGLVRRRAAEAELFSEN